MSIKVYFRAGLVTRVGDELRVRCPAGEADALEIEFDGTTEKRNYGPDAKAIVLHEGDGGLCEVPSLVKDDTDYDPGVEFRFTKGWVGEKHDFGGGLIGLVVTTSGKAQVIEAQGLPFTAAEMGLATKIEVFTDDDNPPHEPR